MANKQAPPQIVDLFEALKDALTAPRFSTDPELDKALEADEAMLIAVGAYDQHPYAKSAREHERTAVLKEILTLKDTYQASNPWGQAAREALDILHATIEQGKHVP